MKVSIFVTTLAVNLLTGGYVYAEAIDYSRGYCVSHGAELRKENALIVIDGKNANGTPVFFEQDHNFFDPHSSKNLDDFDWLGVIRLEKMPPHFGNVIIAFYEDSTHAAQPKVERQLVDCVAEDGEAIVKAIEVPQRLIESQIECVSLTVRDDCFDVQAVLKISGENFSFSVRYTPVCPRWPPPGEFIQGKIRFIENQEVEFLTDKNQVFGKLSYALWTGLYQGKLHGFNFSSCHI